MFEQSLLQNTAKSGWRKTASVALSLAFQCSLVAAMIVSPMIFTEGVPRVHNVVKSWILDPPPPPGPEPIARPTGHREPSGTILPLRPGIVKETTSGPPTGISPIIGTESDAFPSAPQIGRNGPGGGIPGGTGLGIFVNFPDPVAPRAPEQRPQPIQRIRVTTIENSKIVFRPQPAYPAMARNVRVQGLVRLEAIISKTGLIENLRVVSGHPLLTQAALDAVRQWRYTPTVLNGEPVEVITTVDVNFTLNQ